jgi:hypothetical protein
MEQEVWITLRFKGSMDAEEDAPAAAQKLLTHLENHIMAGGQDHGFMVQQNGDVIEVEEERHIYGTAEDG